MIAAEVEQATWYSSIVSCSYHNQRSVSVVHRDKTPKIQAGHSYYRYYIYYRYWKIRTQNNFLWGNKRFRWATLIVVNGHGIRLKYDQQLSKQNKSWNHLVKRKSRGKGKTGVPFVKFLAFWFHRRPIYVQCML